MLGCPFQCIYCNQHSIAGVEKVPESGMVRQIIQRNLSTINHSETRVEVGFFGGTFTALPEELQIRYLSVVQPFLQSGSVKAIRISTRPDFISSDNLNMLQKYGVRTIELGAQSMDDEVLKLSGRGHNAEHTRKAAALIKMAGFRLGLQMMIGLPGDNLEKSLATAREFITLGAEEVRIYPVVVIRNTPLERLYRLGKYQPLTISNAIEISAQLILLFEEHHILITRMGLHPSEELLRGDALVAGPWHPCFRELVYTHLWAEKFKTLLLSPESNDIIKITVPSTELNYAVGYKQQNKNTLKNIYRKVVFVPSNNLAGRTFYVDFG